MPEGVPSEVEICRTDAASMIGACVFLSSSVATSDEGPALEEPLVFAAQCSRLGMLLGREVARFRGSTTLNSSVRAAELLRLVGNEIEGLLEDTSRDLASLNSMKVGTRYEGLRRLNLVRAYLHAVTDRAVDLGELARVAGLSRFQLLRDFRSCFGVPPITYHRRLRLQLASDEISRGQLSCYQAAERYGFADSSSLSRAHRRMFGTAPVRSLRSSFQCSAG